MRPLPKVHSLKEAVIEVIESNKKDGRPHRYQPTYFITETKYGESPDLPGVCRRLIHSVEALQFVEDKIRQIPTLLTLEDFVCHYNPEWKLFDDATVKQACANRDRFDQVAKEITKEEKRYKS